MQLARMVLMKRHAASLAHSSRKMDRVFGRGERIRTSGPCLPKTVLYQAELLPDRRRFRWAIPLGRPQPIEVAFRAGKRWMRFFCSYNNPAARKLNRSFRASIT